MVYLSYPTGQQPIDFQTAALSELYLREHPDRGRVEREWWGSRYVFGEVELVYRQRPLRADDPPSRA